ncbi:phosphatase PAP2 family protein [Granulibacter bethesdensis]|uniref:phosphatase PAP2 family protein n=1 Tax=Granulibacter bethesdensis TaxID=364410 RepID=UPI0003F1D95E|nr:phosphatase PAP2 family protein [Granulibacter bethesdensis]AHJ64868.1 Acid phosphatase [Granulibacter bethesdensis CGDNIH4]
MKIISRIGVFTVSLLLCLLLGPATASRADLGQSEFDQALQALQGIDLASLLPPPPAPGSPQAQMDMEAVRQAVAARTPAQEKKIRADHECVMEQFASVIGPDFDHQHYPRLAAMLDRVYRVEAQLVAQAKAKIGRPRPYTVDPTLKTLETRSAQASYPSGHATFAYMTAAILARIFPEKREALYARAGVFAHNRVEAGSHFPSDLEAGRRSGEALAAHLSMQGAFRAKVENALLTAETGFHH